MQTAVNSTKVQQVIHEIETYIANKGGGYSRWYAGVATDPRRRLFVDHNVNERTDVWIFGDCLTDEAARTVEEYFLRRGCKGGTGGGDNGTHFCYAYRIAPHTKE